MNILQVTAALEQGGVERGTVEMAAYTVRKGATSIVASQGGRMVLDLEEAGASHICLPLAHRHPFAILYCAWKLRNLILEENIDLVHARSRAPAWAAFLACKLTKTPFITTFHGTHKIQNRLKKLYNSSMIRGERVIAISQFIKDHIINNYGVNEQRIDIARRGFDPKVFDPEKYTASELAALKNSLGITGNKPVISLPGRLTRWKGQVLFLEALAKIQQLDWVSLIIGGSGKKQSYFQELKDIVNRYGLADRVIFCGNQPNIAPYYAISDIVVSASTEPEAFGRVAVEAQAMGKPVIVSNHGGSVETVLDMETGWLFENANVDSLVNKFCLALSSNAPLQQMGLNARRWVTTNFQVVDMCEAEWNVYKEVLEKLE